jgi:DNA polymerase-4/DNA polymerase IV (DinB-like DNA polymerase)
MQSITRSRLITAEDNAATIYTETSRLLEQVEKRPVRLIGAGIYNLSPDEGRQMTIDDYLETGDGSLSPSDKPGVIEKKLQELQTRYGLDFAGHMEDILHGRVLYRTIEYMRKHYND